jgi:hypothetical protein
VETEADADAVTVVEKGVNAVRADVAEDTTDEHPPSMSLTRLLSPR